MLSPSILSQRRTMAKDTPLDPHFTPGPYDVICSRGKTAYNHSGNLHFRKYLQDRLEDYRSCPTKLGKSLAVIEIVDEIRKLSPEGGFVKFCKQKNCFFEVGDKLAREKVGHALRELLGKNRSSTSAISKRKEAEKKTSKGEECDQPPLPCWNETPPHTKSVMGLFDGIFEEEKTSATAVETSLEDSLTTSISLQESKIPEVSSFASMHEL